jgi:ABC-type lipoprotein release transport system permease subunit
MKLKDYVNWIRLEVKESKLFTILNIFGITANVILVLIFLALASGIKETALSTFTKDMDLYTIQVSKQSKSLLSLEEFQQFSNDPRVNQVVPVIFNFPQLRFYQENPNGKLKSTTPMQKPVFSLPIYAESALVNDRIQDSKLDDIDLVEGRKITSEDSNAIMVSQELFSKIVSSSNDLINLSNYQDKKLSLVITRESKESLFDCKIVGIISYSGYKDAEDINNENIRIYASFPLASKLDDLLIEQSSKNLTDYQNRQYQRIDIVTKNLSDLQTLRQELLNQGYSTLSVLDRLKGINVVLSVASFIFFFIIGFSVLISGFNLLITLTSYVLKRRREIGILKALGATDFQIESIYILHSLFLCFAGISLGLMMTLLLINICEFILSKFDRFKGMEIFKIEPFQVIIVIVISLILSILASLIPAKKSVSISPVEIMRNI